MCRQQADTAILEEVFRLLTMSVLQTFSAAAGLSPDIRCDTSQAANTSSSSPTQQCGAQPAALILNTFLSYHWAPSFSTPEQGVREAGGA